VSSEFKQFLDTLKRLGIAHEMNWLPSKEEWQQIILDAGYNITALACTVISVGDMDFLFCNSSVIWTDDEQPIGPSGLLLLSRKKSGEIIPRVRYNARDGRQVPSQNLDAIKDQYHLRIEIQITT
jgi:hypothetical protein